MSSQNDHKHSVEPKKARKKRNVLKPHHAKWIHDSIVKDGKNWHLATLNPAFEQQFPELGKNYLTQGHIDVQRQKINQKKINQENPQPEIIGDPTKRINSCTNIKDIFHAVHSTSSMIANQGVYLVDLVDERGDRKEKESQALGTTNVPVEGLIIPHELTNDELLVNTKDIETKTAELVDLLVKRRAHQATQRTVNNVHGKRSIFVGYCADQRPNKRAFHFVAGRNEDIDPTAVQVLQAIYAAQPKKGNIEARKTNVWVQLERDVHLRGMRNKSLDKPPKENGRGRGRPRRSITNTSSIDTVTATTAILSSSVSSSSSSSSASLSALSSVDRNEHTTLTDTTASILLTNTM